MRMSNMLEHWGLFGTSTGVLRKPKERRTSCLQRRAPHKPTQMWASATSCGGVEDALAYVCAKAEPGPEPEVFNANSGLGP